MRGDRCRSAPRRPQIFYTAARDCGRASRVSHPPIPEKKCRPMCAQRPCAKQSDPTSRTRTDTPKCLARPAHKHDQTNAKKNQHTCHACTCVGFSHKDIYAREFLHGSWRGRTKNEIIRDLASWSRRPNLSCTTLCRCILCRTCKLDTLKRHAITAQMMDAGGTCTLCNPTNGRKA